MSLRNLVQAIRHKRGFGIHSPFAFRVATEIIYSKYPYYAYPEIDNAIYGVADFPIMRRRSRIVFRLIARLAPKVAYISPSWDNAIIQTVRLADSRIKITQDISYIKNSNQVIAIIHGKDLNDDFHTLKNLIMSQCAIIYIAFANPAKLSELQKYMQSGVTFYYSDAALFIIRPSMAHNSHFIRL